MKLMKELEMPRPRDVVSSFFEHGFFNISN